MQLFIVLLVLAITFLLENYTNARRWLPQLPWVDTYVEYWYQWLGESKLWNTTSGAILLLVPLPIIVGFIQLVFRDALYSPLALIFNLVIFFYALGPTEIVCTRRSPYNQEDGLACDALETSKPSEFDIADLLQRANERVFAVLLWFVLLGPAGAVLYKLTQVFHETAQEGNENFAHMAPHLLQIKQVLEWLPVRLVSLCFALMGNFTNTFPTWLKSCMALPKDNHKYLTRCGMAALDMEEKTIDNQQQAQAVTSLLERTTVALVALIGLMVVATWFA